MVVHTHITDDYGNLIRVIKYYSYNGVLVRMQTINEFRKQP